ncbi:MAG: YHS domain protein [Desulfatitalea sp.]|nr:YHS domain protein [Desulfatitalea sp.]
MTVSPVWAKSPVNTNWRGWAVKGYDVVAYFTLGQPTKGAGDYTYKWRDATWRFANAEHLAAFTADPERYAPQYGGYCAYAVAMGTTANIDPVHGWQIVDGKLYLNYNRSIQEKWMQDIPGYIEKADNNWPKVLE